MEERGRGHNRAWWRRTNVQRGMQVARGAGYALTDHPVSLCSYCPANGGGARAGHPSEPLAACQAEVSARWGMKCTTGSSTVFTWARTWVRRVFVLLWCEVVTPSSPSAHWRWRAIMGDWEWTLCVCVWERSKDGGLEYQSHLWKISRTLATCTHCSTPQHTSWPSESDPVWVQLLKSDIRCMKYCTNYCRKPFLGNRASKVASVSNVV